MVAPVRLLSCIFLLVSMGFLCASFVAGMEYGRWTVAAVLGFWSLCTGLYAADAAARAEDRGGVS
jgi:hypothetical protein